MSSAAPASGGTISCPQCRQALPVGTARCLYCGVVIGSQSSQGSRFAPRGPGGANPTLIADVPVHLLGAEPAYGAAPYGPPAPAYPGDPAAHPAARAAVIDIDPRASRNPQQQVARPPRADAETLGPRFVGSPAGVGLRVAAFTIDAAVVATIVIAVGLLSRSLVLTLVAMAEVLAVMWVLQARTGLGLGKAMLGLRVAREDAPFSPGVGRALVRGLVTAAGGLVLLVGAWIVEASAAWDASGRRRSWADRAAKTVVVAVPPRSEGSAERADRSAAVLAPPVVVREPDAANPATRADPLAGGAGERIRPNDVAESVAIEEPVAPARPVQDAPPAGTASPSMPPAYPTAPPLPSVAASPSSPVIPAAPAAPLPATPPERTPPVPAAASVAPGPAPLPPSAEPPRAEPPAAEPPPVRIRRRPGAVVPDEQQPGPRRSAAVAAGPEEQESGVLVLVFDTGQRERIGLPGAANLGRNPVAHDPADVLIRVDDHESTVSRTHARLESTGDMTWVTDNGSTNGTDLVDETGRATPLQPGVRTVVEDGDRVRVGNRVFTVSRLIGGAS